MEKKINQYLLRTDEKLAKEIDEVLESFPRAKFPTKADLLREAIKLGLGVIKESNNKGK